MHEQVEFEIRVFIAEMQNGFLRGQSIHQNFLMTNEIEHSAYCLDV